MVTKERESMCVGRNVCVCVRERVNVNDLNITNAKEQSAKCGNTKVLIDR